ncbi:hypothetical protein [Aureivirga sp. CE67]|uniref:hypothetical protein n=1 Tax=Aureivirga sp. CE67 TaxID=1788983 RepID=UPI0018CAA19D|nr:hypothetical protein [Aureivirga sp. CE67]
MNENNNIINNYINKFFNSPIERTGNYWFVRTDKGVNFDIFTTNGFVGIGWNDIELSDLIPVNEHATKRKIALVENLDIDESSDKSKITSIYNKLIRFNSLSKGDVIVSPSRKSKRIAFGVVESENCYWEENPNDFCEHKKRVKVNWVLTKNFNTLDSMFYKIKGSRHSISDIKGYAPFIDKEMNTFYFKDNSGHYVVDVRSSNDINTFALVEFIYQTNNFLSIINEEFDFQESIDDSSIKLNVQSPGKIEFKMPGGKTMLLLTILIPILGGCEDAVSETPDELKSKLKNIVEKHPDKSNELKKAMDELEVKYDSINSYH